MGSRYFKFLLLFHLFLLIFCSSGISTLTDNEQKELYREEEQIFHLFHRQLINAFQYESSKQDLTDAPTTVYPSNPVTNPVTTPSTSPQNDPAPAVVNVPSTNPIIVTPNPGAIPVTVPSVTPVSLPNANPVNSPFPVTNPVTTPSTYPGGQPVTNPVTNPVPAGGFPVTSPVTPPATTNAPAVPGQSWCVAKSGSLETALQSALDYACGTGIADCSAIQQGGSCYNPNTLEYHASYAFNSYYQKNPVQTSCDFGGAAMITNANPSTGSCIFLTSSTSSSPSPVTENPTPASPTPTTASSSGATVPLPGAEAPPFVLNSSNPASGGIITGFPESPAGFNTSTSKSNSLQPFFGCIVLVTSFMTGKHILDI